MFPETGRDLQNRPRLRRSDAPIGRVLGARMTFVNTVRAPANRLHSLSSQRQ